MHRTIRCLLATGLVPALVALAANSAAAQTREYDSLFAGRTIDFELPAETARAKSLLAQGNSRVDPGIRSLIAQGSGLGAAGFGALAKDLAVPLGARRSVAVALTPERGASVDDLIDRAGEHGAAVSFVFDDVVFAHVPLDAVHELGDSEELYYMSRQAELKPAYPALAAGAAAADGVRSVRADRLHAEGITGKGVRVGILDFGFERYRELQSRGLLPAPVAARAFNEAGTVESGGVHGTACAEIVHAMAPDAGIYLAAVDGREDQIIEAAFWLAEQGIDILSFSGGGHVGPHNGRSLLDRLVEKITESGILWVNAAGNEGTTHWRGKAMDRNGDGWVEIGPRGENFMVIRPEAGGIATMVVWDDWGSNEQMPASTQDIDAYLFRYDPKKRRANLVAKSVNPQRGRGAPLEFIGRRVPPERPYLLALRAEQVTRPVAFHVYSNLPASLAPAEALGSVAIPATSEARPGRGRGRRQDGSAGEVQLAGPDRRRPPEAGGVRTGSNHIELLRRTFSRNLGGLPACGGVRGAAQAVAARIAQPGIAASHPAFGALHGFGIAQLRPRSRLHRRLHAGCVGHAVGHYARIARGMGRSNRGAGPG